MLGRLSLWFTPLVFIVSCSQTPLITTPTATNQPTRFVFEDNPPTESEPISLLPPSPIMELRINPPQPVACSLVGSNWTGTLHINPLGPPFGTLQSTSISLQLPTERGPAYVESFGSIQFRALTPSVALYLDRPTALGGFIIPFSKTKLTYEGSNSVGSLIVSLDISDVFSSPSQLKEQLACSEISISDTGYDARKFAGKGSKAYVTITQESDFRAVENGRVVARIKASPSATITLGDKVNKQRKIFLETNTFLAVGWIEEPSIKPDLGLLAAGFGYGVPTSMHSSSRSAYCYDPISLYAEVGDERAIVGTILPKTRFQIIPIDANAPESDFYTVQLMTVGFTLAPGAKLLIRKRDYTNCK